ncbi:MAG: hypothetical protein NTX86_05635 [Candidatus Dependentiae bacterium]|nr:hypothetical protein [Candidatus Dependentiae bacterium]
MKKIWLSILTPAAAVLSLCLFYQEKDQIDSLETSVDASLSQDDQTMNTQEAANVIDNITKQITQYKKQIKNITDTAIQNDFSLLNELKKATDQLNKIKDESGITALETKITQGEDEANQAAVAVYSKAFNPDTNMNYFREINQQVYAAKKSIKDSLSKLDTLKREIKEKLTNSDWLTKIQKYGTAIDAQTTKEQTAVTAFTSGILQAKANLIGARANAATKLDPAERFLNAVNLKILKKAADTSTENKVKIDLYENATRQLQLILEFIRNPKVAMTLTEEHLAGIDS